MIYIINALPQDALIRHSFRAYPIDCLSVRHAVRDGAVSAVRHDAVASALSLTLGVDVPCMQASIRLVPGDVMYVAVLRGLCLAEGQVLSAKEVTVLLAGRGFDFLKVVITG